MEVAMRRILRGTIAGMLAATVGLGGVGCGGETTGTKEKDKGTSGVPDMKKKMEEEKIRREKMGLTTTPGGDLDKDKQDKDSKKADEKDKK
jgi:hypothetical protein